LEELAEAILHIPGSKGEMKSSKPDDICNLLKTNGKTRGKSSFPSRFSSLA
jgi:hypothetical protein